MMGKLSILGICVSRLDYGSATEAIVSAAKEARPMRVAALAVHGVMEGFYDKELARQLNSFDMVTPDGQPVKWALNLLGAREVKERVCGPILMLKVCERAASEKLPVFLYGSRPEVLEKLRENLLKLYPELIIAGMQADRFREATPDEDKKDIAVINGSGARIVFVGRGCPRQERWIALHASTIRGAMIAVGAAFDFHAGMFKRPPKFLQDLGLEWVFRLAQEPKRLWRRYLLLNPLFIFNFCRQLLGVQKNEE
ncbi:MAG: WecB/TagA/CpsF family glycosyltransferase [Candidatus Omnitrophica bacterium]|nr:WecB/TagA/CpsF family glycosyltransferase [Candidatus Omnitrophota bacterium]